MVERRLKNLGMQVDLLFLKDEALLSRALEDLTQRGTLFAVVVTNQHELHGSVTVNILYGVPQGEFWVARSSVGLLRSGLFPPFSLLSKLVAHYVVVRTTTQYF